MSDHVNGFDRWWEDRGVPEKVFLVSGLVILGAGLLFVFGLVTMALWNRLMPEIFGLKPLTYWQAWGVLALSCILFGKTGRRGSSAEGDRKRKQDLSKVSTLSPSAGATTS